MEEVGSIKKKLLNLESTIIWFESPKRVVIFLEELLMIFGNRKAVVARELTKAFQEILRNDLNSLITNLKSRNNIKGEFVILLEGFAPLGKEMITQDIKKKIKTLLEFDTLKSVVKQISNETNFPKKIIYSEALKIKDSKLN